jgi:hypothetical protein
VGNRRVGIAEDRRIVREMVMVALEIVKERMAVVVIGEEYNRDPQRYGRR